MKLGRILLMITVSLFFYRELEDYMSDKVNFVVTNSDWDQNFDDVSTCTVTMVTISC